MPEGDTIFRAAARLRGVLQGKCLEAARIDWPTITDTDLAGLTVQSVEARGKHLLIHFDDRRTLHSHLGMSGSWQLYPSGSPWRKPAHHAAVVLKTAAVDVVCFTPKTLELLTVDRLRRHPYLQRLGPDLLAGTLDRDTILSRFRVHDATPLGEAVMNQTIVCGVGNVYKSELLFLEGRNPFQPVRLLDNDQLWQLVEQASGLLRKNRHGGRRTTRHGNGDSRLWVYGRGGRPCLKCGCEIAVRRQGDLGRTTYFCADCQAVVLR